MPPSDFAKVDLSKVLEELATDEAISLIAGVGFWHTCTIEKLGIPAVKVSDGPNGIRGGRFLMSAPAKVLLSSTVMGATFDPELLHTIGLKLLAPEAKLKAVSLNPLSGKSFESFSEDPYLSGILASAYIRGPSRRWNRRHDQTLLVHHFFYGANDKEDERYSYDSIASDHALREIYTMPFMLAQKYAQPWAIMTAYDRLNGTHVEESPNLLQDVVRKEWGFDGMFVSDWDGTYSVDTGINAGVDLEMPGVNKWRTLDFTKRCVNARKLTVRTIKERALHVLKVVQNVPGRLRRWKVLDGDGEERTHESEEDTVLLRKVAAESIVLLKNDNGVLPIDKTKVKVAIVGGNAKAPVLSGGGSVALKPSYFVSPYDGIASAFGKDVEVTYSEGARASLTLPTLELDLTTEKGKGERGWTVEWYSHESNDSMKPLDTPIATEFFDETRLFIGTSYPKGITRKWTMKLRGFLKPKPYDIDFESGIIAAGRAKLWVDGNPVIDNWTRQSHGDYFSGFGSAEERGVYHLQANNSRGIYVEFCNDEMLVDRCAGVQLGGVEVCNSDDLMNQAVELAREADVVIAVVGLNPDFEMEGYDRKTLALPGRTDELIQRVAEVNKHTVVVTQTGSAITMPWVDAVPSIVHAWYLGNTTGDAIAQVLLGDVNPAGRLSLTFPKRLEDVPSYVSFSVENGKVRYSEDLLVVSRGHGLSYTTFQYFDLKLSEATYTAGDIHITATLTLTNTGSVTGSEAIQLYVTLPPAVEYAHPPLQLRAFKKVKDLGAGASEEVILRLDKYAVSYWDERYSTWNVDKGVYTVRVGGSSAEDALVLSGQFRVPRSFTWNGL
ncbi:hypothetical protein BDM02DRAFT_3156218 [Thelephora ganbajun]|uniref:Uncharacterized protein n=1 Tax=Thelephora ganbajun TaxID=370292 RepID=A0ACB6ZCH9_THEGA|nr:hypothetical protein BDM02DRAFT_3156218 [Thelephora ganbajun]